MTWLSFVIGTLGTLLLLISALGLFRLRDALARQHAATKSATLALGLILVSVALQAGMSAWWIRIGLIVVFLFATLPVASHMLARAAARETCAPSEFSEAPCSGRERRR
jgi:multicomponent Na+:H+ antiporter subunit G